MNKLQEALDKAGHSMVARACDISKQAVGQWWLKGKLPDTEWLDKSHPRRTDYATVIAKMAGCKRSELL